MTFDQRYTLDEARAIIAEQDCHRHGHDLGAVRTAAGDTLWVYCSNCPARFAPTRPDYREYRAALLGQPDRGDRQAHCPDELLTLVGAIAPCPVPGPTGEPTVEQWAGQIRMVVDQIWREAHHAGATWWAEREPTRIVLEPATPPPAPVAREDLPQVQCDDDEPHPGHRWLDGHDLFGAGAAYCNGVPSPAGVDL